jgi:Aconitase X
MRLTDEEQAMLAGECGEPRRWAIEHQIAVGEFFDAEDFVPVSQAHIMADTERSATPVSPFWSVSAQLRRPSGACGCRRSPIRAASISRSTGSSGRATGWRHAKAERFAALRAFGVLVADTCINYQTIMAPVRENT